MSLRTEIFEQPAVLARLLETHLQPVQEMARTIHERKVTSIFLAARGTSDNAGIYGKYLWGAVNRLPVALAAPSLFSIYQAPPMLAGSLVIGISQSGQSPDIVNVVREGRRQGALTLAITNEPGSPLAEEAELVLDMAAGPEKAVAATKTYTAQLLCIALLSVALRNDQEMLADLRRLPELVAEVLGLDSTIKQVVERYRYMTQCVVLGRGYNYATAFEWSLKLKELTYTVAAPYSSADFQHGPVAIVSHGFPVLAVIPQGAVFDDVMALLTTLAEQHHAELLVLSNQQRALDLAQTRLRLPEQLPEWLSPLVTIIPAQLFCCYLTEAKGFDTESPRGLNKVTCTW